MAYVITGPCKDEMAAECVDVCPVDCIEQEKTNIISIRIFA